MNIPKPLTPELKLSSSSGCLSLTNKQEKELILFIIGTGLLATTGGGLALFFLAPLSHGPLVGSIVSCFLGGECLEGSATPHIKSSLYCGSSSAQIALILPFRKHPSTVL